MTASVEDRLAATRARWAEPHRHYHATTHLDSLLSLFAELRSSLHDPEAVRLAIFYHDAIYRPDRADNETASAALMRSDLDGLVDAEALSRAETLILATRQHRIPESVGADCAADCALFLDMDISILGAGEAEFDRYEAGIAAEYLPHYDLAAYRAGRAAVLAGFLARDRLFLSESFFRLEAPARANLARSLAALESGPGEARPPRGMLERWLTIVGIGEDGLAGLGAGARAVLDAAEILVGGERHLAMIPPSTAERLVWRRPIESSLAQLRARRGRRMVVLASGDPMQYGIGATLLRSVPIAEITVLPAPGAFSLAAARLGWALPQVATLSLHGRPLDRLAFYLAPGARLLALTENGAAPARIARWLAERGWGPSLVTVLERLGGPAERITDATADAFAQAAFADLNTLAIEARPGPAARWWSRQAGLPDAAFRHDGQLTKGPIRAATLAALAPCGAETLWDVGAGCGSIAIEWLRALEHGSAHAIERDPARAALISANAVTLGVPDLNLVQGSAPAALGGLPAPDAVFIGGGVDADLLEFCRAALEPGGRLVANAVTVEGEASLAEFRRRWGGELIRLACSRAEALGGHHVWRALAPVTQLIWRKEPAPP
jgi:precorrin-6B C5,15-methyltransferase / cobalt-precorrin-6B C5,C15-methyltransferase